MSGLPDRPDLDQLRRQARELLRAAANGEPNAADRLRAVSPRVTLSAAQLALAREHGFQSWPALKAEVARRRAPAAPADRWSFGGAAAILQTPAGILLPGILIADAGQAILHGSLTLSGNSQLAEAVSRRRRSAPGALLARLVTRGNTRAIRDRRAELRAVMESMRALATVTIIDDRGTRYALRGGSASGPRAAPDRLVRLRVHPVPVREVRWIELRGPDGTTVRLLPSPQAAARTGQPGPARVTPAEPSGPPGAAQWSGSPRLYRDIGVALPAVDGVSIHLDSLLSLPESWQLYVRAQPRWRNHNRTDPRAKDPVSVHAEDDRGGSYLGTYAWNTGLSSEEEHAMEREELALQFLPRLDPLTRALKLTFHGAHEEITVDLDIGAAAGPRDVYSAADG
jgi:hypothetical protein